MGEDVPGDRRRIDAGELEVLDELARGGLELGA
jgi:hypothetical protein